MNDVLKVLISLSLPHFHFFLFSPSPTPTPCLSLTLPSSYTLPSLSRPLSLPPPLSPSLSLLLFSRSPPLSLFLSLHPSLPSSLSVYFSFSLPHSLIKGNKVWVQVFFFHKITIHTSLLISCNLQIKINCQI